MAKPFQREELQVRLRQLIELRKKLQEHYGGLFAEEIAGARSSVDVEFLRKVRQAVEENISDSEFGIAQLCRAVALSRSQLFRKLKALTGKSTTLVVRSIRLQRGRQLLLRGKLNVSEVAYSVGFKDPNYFTRCFQDEFGELPSTVRAN